MMEDAAFYLKRFVEFTGYPFSLQEEIESAVPNRFTQKFGGQ